MKVLYLLIRLFIKLCLPAFRKVPVVNWVRLCGPTGILLTGNVFRSVREYFPAGMKKILID